MTLIVQHSNVDARLGPLQKHLSIGRIHHLHHVNWGTEGDCNFGLLLTVWDRLLGTFQETPSRPITAADLGVDEMPNFPKGYVEQFFLPIFYKPGAGEPERYRKPAADEPERPRRKPAASSTPRSRHPRPPSSRGWPGIQLSGCRTPAHHDPGNKCRDDVASAETKRAAVKRPFRIPVIGVARRYVFIDEKNSPLVLVERSLSIRNSMRVHGAHRVEDAAQHVDLLELILGNQQVLLAGAGARHVDRREHALVGDLAVENDFRVAGALELFEDHLVHARAGVDRARWR